jgi:hypothetical protein
LTDALLDNDKQLQQFALVIAIATVEDRSYKLFIVRRKVVGEVLHRDNAATKDQSSLSTNTLTIIITKDLTRIVYFTHKKILPLLYGSHDTSFVEGRLLATAVVKAGITEAATAATFAVAVGVGRFAAAAIVAVVDGKATSGFPDKSNQKLFASVRTARSARPSTLARYAIGRVFWMAQTRGRSRFVSR